MIRTPDRVLATLLAGFSLAPATCLGSARLLWVDATGSPKGEAVQQFVCDLPATDYTFVATFESDSDIPNVTSLQVPIRLGYFTPPHTPPQPLSPFWHFEFGGCNDIGMSVSVTKPSGLSATNLWAPFPANVRVNVFYTPDSPVTGQGVLSLDLERSTSGTIQAGVTYFAFAVTLHTCTSQVCAGCGEELGLLLGNLNLGDADVPADDQLICINQCVSFEPNVASRPIDQAVALSVANVEGGCETTPTVKQSWGQLKVVYR